jgi:hypothetical protein
MSELPEPQWTTLRILASTLNEAEVEWRLGGSALLAILGVDVEVHDLDVTVATDALDAVEAACRPWIRESHVGGVPSPWCSDWLLEARIGDTEVDLIGGFCVLGPSGRTRVPQDLGGILDVDGIEVLLADPAVWWWVYRTYRPAKAAALAERIPPERRTQVAARLDGKEPR